MSRVAYFRTCILSIFRSVVVRSGLSKYMFWDRQSEVELIDVVGDLRWTLWVVSEVIWALPLPLLPVTGEEDTNKSKDLIAYRSVVPTRTPPWWCEHCVFFSCPSPLFLVCVPYQLPATPHTRWNSPYRMQKPWLPCNLGPTTSSKFLFCILGLFTKKLEEVAKKAIHQYRIDYGNMGCWV